MKIATKKYLLTLILLTINVFFTTSFAVTAEDTEKIYQAEKNRIEELENKAQYHGDDEQVRTRLNLPSKLPPYEEWVRSNIDSLETKQNQPDIQTNETGLQKQDSEKIPVEEVLKEETKTPEIEGVICSNRYDSKGYLITDSNGNPKQSCTFTHDERIINYSIFLLLLLINFICYCNYKKIRFLLISVELHPIVSH